MKDNIDPNLAIITRIIQRLCISRPGAFTVRRDKNRQIWIRAAGENIGQILGKRGKNLKAVQMVASKLGLPESVALDSYGNPKATTPETRDAPLELLQDIMEAVLGAPAIIEDDEAKGKGPQHYVVYCPRHMIDHDLKVALDDIFYATSFKDGEYLKFRFLPQ